MATTLTILDASDIDLIEDPVHNFLFGELLVLVVSINTAIKKVNPDDADDKFYGVRGLLAEFLNSAAKLGIQITAKS